MCKSQKVWRLEDHLLTVPFIKYDWHFNRCQSREKESELCCDRPRGHRGRHLFTTVMFRRARYVHMVWEDETP